MEVVGPEVDLEAIPTLGDIPRRHAQDRPDHVALSFEGRNTTFGEFQIRTSRVANALLGLGVRAGQRVAYYGKNSDSYFELLCGAAKIGAVTTPIGWRLSAAEAGYILADCEAPVLFLGRELMGAQAAVLAESGRRPRVIGMEGPSPEGFAFAAWRDAASDLDTHAAASPDDVAVQLYTSGTTGRPKGAMLSHAGLFAGWRAAARAGLGWNRWGPTDVSLVAMPVGHIGGTGWGMVGLLHGARGVVVREFDPSTVLDAIAREGISKLFMVPSALQIVVRQPKARTVDFSRLKHILYGASPIPLDLLRECMDVFGCGFVQQYGMTETCGTIVYLPPDDHDPGGSPRMRAAGVAMPGVELKIVGSEGEQLAAHQVGEVATRSASNMVGYWRLPDATAKTVDADGWLFTGDAGYLDVDGYLFIQDRVKDMIISGAENIYPAEVENAIYGHPAVSEVAVVGVPDAKWGEAVKAFVVLKDGASASADEVIVFAKGRIAGFKVPKSVDFVDALPKNPTGKVLRRELRAPYWAGRERQVN
jgi:long-chain acyl-CoA synthetase